MYRFLIVLSCLVLACAPQQEKSDQAPAAETAQVQSLSAQAAAPLLKQDSSIRYLDVRTPGEFNSGHIAGAQNIDWNGPDFATAVATLDKNQPYFVYCASGRRSSEAVAKMQALGFKRLYNLEGGIQSWQSQGLPTTAP
jgi:rhodanese-related sulfurtransferase